MSKENIVACVIYYNEIDNIERCLKSLKGKVDRIVCIDGAYKDFPHTNHLTTDGSTEIIEKYTECIVQIDRCWHNEIEKRNAYLKCVYNDDIVIVIDADEEMIGNVDKDEFEIEKEDSNIKKCRANYFYDIKLERLDNVPQYWIYRAFKYIHKMEYKGTHHALHAFDQLTNNLKHKQIESFHFKHYMTERNEQRILDKGIYYRILQEKEKEFRQIHSL